MPSRRPAVALLALVSVVPGLLSCGGDDEGDDATGATTATTGATTATTGAVDAGGPGAPDDGGGTPAGVVSDEYCAHAAEVRDNQDTFEQGVEDPEVARLAAAMITRLGELAPSGHDDYVVAADSFLIFAEFLETRDQAALAERYDETAVNAALDRIEATVEDGCGFSLSD